VTHRPMAIWDRRMLGYHHPGGQHPMNPLRWELTWQLAGALGVVNGYTVVTPGPADVATLGLVHTLGYIDAVRRASRPGFAFSVGYGLGTVDDPIFAGMHTSAALIAGGSVGAALSIATGEVDRAVNFCGGLHHAMADSASGFCVYNDAALAIATMLRAGVGKVAYVDVDAHHGDGVQAAFYDEPRVLTVSVAGHRHPRWPHIGVCRADLQSAGTTPTLSGSVPRPTRPDQHCVNRRAPLGHGPRGTLLATSTTSSACERSPELRRGRIEATRSTQRSAPAQAAAVGLRPSRLGDDAFNDWGHAGVSAPRSGCQWGWGCPASGPFISSGRWMMSHWVSSR